MRRFTLGVAVSRKRRGPRQPGRDVTFVIEPRGVTGRRHAPALLARRPPGVQECLPEGQDPSRQLRDVNAGAQLRGGGPLERQKQAARLEGVLLKSVALEGHGHGVRVLDGLVMPRLGHEVLGAARNVGDDLQEHAPRPQGFARRPEGLAREHPVGHVFRGHEEVEGRARVVGSLLDSPVVVAQLREEVLRALQARETAEAAHCLQSLTES